MLKDRHRYRNLDGQQVTIMGPAKDYPQYVWSLQGNWYERTTGKFVSYHRQKGHCTHDEATGRDLDLRVEPEDVSAEFPLTARESSGS